MRLSNLTDRPGPPRLARAALILVALVAACSPASGTDTVPPDSPTGQTYEPVSGGAISVSWRNPRAPDFAATMLARIVTGSDKPSSTRPSAKTNPKVGDPFGGSGAFGPGVVLYVGKATTFLDVETPNMCTAFVYQLFSKDNDGNWSVGPAQVDVDPGATSAAPLLAPTAFTAAAVGGDVQLAWTNPPAGSGWTELHLVRKFSVAPANPTDGVVVFSGSTASAASRVNPPRKIEHCANAACSNGLSRFHDHSIAPRSVA